MSQQAKKLKLLERKRLSVLSKLNDFGDFIDETVAETLDDNSIEVKMLELEQRIEEVSKLTSEFDEIQVESEIIVDEGDLPALFEKRKLFQKSFHSALSRGQKLLKEFRHKLGVQSDHSDQASEVGMGSAASNACPGGRFKLPTIKIPEFHGSYDLWLEFRDSFKSLIHKNANLTEIEKFHYLRSILKGEAALVIRQLDFSKENYSKAWLLLCTRYNNQRLLISNHIRALFDIEKISHESASKLRSLSGDLIKHLGALQTLGQDVASWDVLIIHVVSAKLDKVTNRNWEELQSGSDPPTLEQFQNFLKSRADFLESIELKSESKPLERQTQSKTETRALLTPQSRSYVCCSFCSKDHMIHNCGQFEDLSVHERQDHVNKERLCSNCLRSGHFVAQCRVKIVCKKCSKKHSTLLHHEPSAPGNQVNLSAMSQQTVLLSTASVQVMDKAGKYHTVRVVLDSGSQSSYITESLSKRLRIEMWPVEMTVTGLNSTSSKISSQCKVKIKYKQTNFTLDVSAFVVPEITGILPEHRFDASHLAIPRHLKLADPEFNEPKRIEMLLGAALFWDLVCAAQIKLGPQQHILQKTKLGWLVSEPIQVSCNSTGKTHCNFSSSIELHEQVARFWEIEEGLFPTKALSNEEQLCESHFVETVSRDNESRFVVSVPLKGEPALLGDSKERAERQFLQLERRLGKNPKLKQLYADFMVEYEELGHMSLVTDDAPDIPSYFMPHHGVLREESETTRLRVVFNASAPTTSGYSYNDLQMVGATIQQDLISIILRFRQHSFVVAADIEKIYRQVLVCDDQKPLQRIVWRIDPSLPLSTFQLNTVTYGTASAPFLAVRCLFEIVQRCEDEFPTASKVIKRDFYVDDLISGSDSVEGLRQVCQEVASVLKDCHFPLRKWTSNCSEVLEGFEESSLGSIDFGSDVDDVSKTLGLIWSPKTDQLSFKIRFEDDSKNGVTKRNILSKIARIFDPLGLLGPVVIVPKLLLQELWQLKLSWDEALPLDLHTKWIQLRDELTDLNDLKINRHVVCLNPVRIELHGFSDASQGAYGACIYVRSFSADGTIVVRLLCAKSKVSPLKTITVPRLELCGALVLARLYAKVHGSLELQFDDCYFWSDSTIVLAWLKIEPNKLGTFVANRVSEITQTTDSHSWHHVSTHENPADLLSRGVSPSLLIHAKLWWSGPGWLSDSDPLPIGSTAKVENLPELKKTVECLVIKEDIKPGLSFCKEYSCWNRLRRAVAYLLRFKFNCFHRDEHRYGPLTTIELREVEICLITASQRRSFPVESHDLKKYKMVNQRSKLLKLSPFIHDDGTFRVGGRLKNAECSFDQKHPMILSSADYLTELIFRHEHGRLFHAGPQLLLATIRQRFWPLSGRGLARRVVSNCTRCTRARPKPLSALMGNLPVERVVPSPPFYQTGVDYAGPLWFASKKGRGSKLSKCYVCVFVCFSTKCVHLELVSDLSTKAFLMSMRRFVARRGKPQAMFSDNGTNFVGGNNELKELGRLLQGSADSLSKILAQEGVNWQFIPPYSPHFGGLWEAAVKSMKCHLKRVAGNAHFTYEELSTLLAQIEAILNSRPLSPLSSNPSDLTPLTPAHFLVGRPLTSLPDENLHDVKEGRLTRFQRVQQVVQHFWRRWNLEYLAERQERAKWNRPGATINEGDLIIVKEDNLPPLKWKMGRASQLHPGKDGVVRLVSIQTDSGIIKRAVAKICPLLSSEQT